jgi:hypothetical protein
MQQLRPQLRGQRREALNELVWQADESTGLRRSQTDCFSLDSGRTIEMGATVDRSQNSVQQFF